MWPFILYTLLLMQYNHADIDVSSETASEALDDLRGGKTNTPSQIRRVMSTAVPGTTYPTLSQIPQTSFSCDSVNQSGYYADPETGCQVYRQCLPDMPMFSYICPNKTLFNQVTLVCDWWYNVDCSKSAFYYSYSNPRLYQEHVLFLYDSAQDATPSSNDTNHPFGILRSVTHSVPDDSGTGDSTTESSNSDSTDSSVTTEASNGDQSPDSSATSEASSTDESPATTEADTGATTDQSVATTESEASTEADASATTEADATTDSGAATTEAAEASTDSASGTEGNSQLDDSSTEVAPVTDETTAATDEASTETTVNIGPGLPTDFGANLTNVTVSADSALNPDINATGGSLGDLSNTTILIGLPNAHLEAAESESTESPSSTEASEGSSTTESSTEAANATTEASMLTSEATFSETSEAATDQSAVTTEATTETSVTSSESEVTSESTTVAEPEATTEQAPTESGTTDAGTTAELSTVVAGLPEGALVFTVPTFRTSTATSELMRLGGRASRALIGFGSVSTEELPRVSVDRATTMYPTNQIQRLYAATAMEDEDSTTMEPLSSHHTADDSLSTTVQLPPVLIDVENASLSPQLQVDNMTGLAMAILSSRTNTSGSAEFSSATMLPLFPLDLLQKATDSALHGIQSNSMILSNATVVQTSNNASLDGANQTLPVNTTINLDVVTANPLNLDSDFENATQYTWTIPPTTTMLQRLETQGPGISMDRLLGRLPGFPTGSEPNFIGVSQNVSLITVDLDLASNSTSGTSMSASGSSSPLGFSSGSTNMLTSGSSTKALELNSGTGNFVTDPGSTETAATQTPSSSSSFFVTEVAANNFQAMLQQLYARLGNGAAGGKGAFVVAFVPGELSSNLTGTAG